MADRIWRGDAVAIAQVSTLTPSVVEVGDIFTAVINGKDVPFTATAATVANVVTGLTAAINDSTIAEFTEITAVDSTTAVTLTATTPGVPFTITGSTTNTATGAVVVVETTPGVAPVDEIQKLELLGSPSGGTFTITWDVGGDETTGTIAWNATAATVRVALEGLATPTVGDFIVTGGAGPSNPWFVQFTGTYAATAVNPLRVNGGSLTGTSSVTIAETVKGAGDSNEIQFLNMRGATAGTYTFVRGAQSSATIAFDATAATVATALDNMSQIGSGNSEIFGGDGSSIGERSYWIRFKGAYLGASVGGLTINTTLLTHDAAALTTEQKGGVAAENNEWQWQLGRMGSRKVGRVEVLETKRWL